MRLKTLGLLFDIRQAAGHILEYTEGLTYESFASDRMILHAVERNFTIIGEAVNRLRRYDPLVAERVSQVHQMVGMRNILVHAYERIDYSIVWESVTESIPILYAEANALIREGDAGDVPPPDETSPM